MLHVDPHNIRILFMLLLVGEFLALVLGGLLMGFQTAFHKGKKGDHFKQHFKKATRERMHMIPVREVHQA